GCEYRVTVRQRWRLLHPCHFPSWLRLGVLIFPGHSVLPSLRAVLVDDGVDALPSGGGDGAAQAVHKARGASDQRVYLIRGVRSVSGPRSNLGADGLIG